MEEKGQEIVMNETKDMQPAELSSLAMGLANTDAKNQSITKRRQAVVNLLQEGIAVGNSVIGQTLAAFVEIVDALEVHRTAKLNLMQLGIDDDDVETTKEMTKEGGGAGSRPKQDMYGQTLAAVCSDEVVCPRCGNICAAGRFANHLGKCYGKGRAAARNSRPKYQAIGSSAIAPNMNLNMNMNKSTAMTVSGNINSRNVSTLPDFGLDGAIFDLPTGPLSMSVKGARTTSKKKDSSSKHIGRTPKAKDLKEKASKSVKGNSRGGSKTKDKAKSKNDFFGDNPLASDVLLGGPGDASFLDGAFPSLDGKDGDFLKDLALMGSADPNAFSIGNTDDFGMDLTGDLFDNILPIGDDMDKPPAKPKTKRRKK